MPRSVRIAQIEDLSAEHVAKLHLKDIKTVDDLWRRVGSKFDTGIDDLSKETNVPEDVITAVLIAEGLGKLKTKNGPLSYFQHVETYVGLVLVALVAYAVYLPAFKVELPQQVVVINSQGIAAYRVIGKDDVALRRVPFRRSQTLSDLGTVIGGYALTKLEPNAPIRQNQILAADVSRVMTGSYIVSVPVKASSLVLAPKPGAKLWLLPLPQDSKDKPQTPTEPIEAVLLGIEQRDSAPTLVVAVAKKGENINALMAGATIVSVVP